MQIMKQLFNWSDFLLTKLEHKHFRNRKKCSRSLSASKSWFTLNGSYILILVHACYFDFMKWCRVFSDYKFDLYEERFVVFFLRSAVFCKKCFIANKHTWKSTGIDEKMFGQIFYGFSVHASCLPRKKLHCTSICKLCTLISKILVQSSLSILLQNTSKPLDFRKRPGFLMISGVLRKHWQKIVK